MTEYHDCYDGSKILQPIANKCGMPIDIVNFLFAQVTALCLARLFRKPLKYASSELRHTLCLSLGLLMIYFCFGKQAIHISLLTMLTFVMFKCSPPAILGNVILATSMIYLSCLHLHRQAYHTAEYSLDITGPMMVITQRVTSLAYSIQDQLTGKTNNGQVSSDSKVNHIEKMPTPLEYFSYTLAFQTLMCGPIVFYPDYIKFIEGTDTCMIKLREKVTPSDSKEASPRRAVIYKMAGSLTAAVLYLYMAKQYPLGAIQDIADPTSEASRTWSAFYLMWYAYLATLGVRCKYYHAWLMSEAICNNSGLGFNGYDANGNPKWDKMSNVDVWGFEFAQNFRNAVASWNKNTNAWLRHVAYARGEPAFRTARVYALSALWHGFHPGYYLTFLAGGLFTVAARRIRGVVRPMFLDSQYKKMLYDVLTFLTTRVAMTYAVVPFVLLHFGSSLAFYGKFFFSLHFLAIGALLLPEKSRSSIVEVNHDRPKSSNIQHKNE